MQPTISKLHLFMKKSWSKQFYNTIQVRAMTQKISQNASCVSLSRKGEIFWSDQLLENTHCCELPTQILKKASNRYTKKKKHHPSCYIPSTRDCSRVILKHANEKFASVLTRDDVTQLLFLQEIFKLGQKVVRKFCFERASEITNHYVRLQLALTKHGNCEQITKAFVSNCT